MAGGSVHCVVTSPPYWGLRDYGVAGQLGLEADYREYVVKMVGVFREVRRVLREDGVCWVNMGDSYAGGGRGGNPEGSPYCKQGTNSGSVTGVSKNKQPMCGLKAKDLCGIPWRLAFALQEDGWWLRQDIIWSKPNPMPESVTDRCTKAHEYVFLLSKSEMYYFDGEAVKEPMAECSIARINQPTFHAQKGGPKDYGPDSNRSARKALENLAANSNGTRNRRSVWEIPEDEYAQFLQWKAQQRVASGVWDIATAPFPGAHFATYPPALVEPCILAGCPVGGTVLDPFFGAGTTGLVADRLGRNCIGIELNHEYAAMAERRLREDAGMFAEIL